MKKTVLIIVLFFLVTAGVFAQFADFNIDRRTVIDQEDFFCYVTFHAYGPGTITPSGKPSTFGHVFVEFSIFRPFGTYYSELRGMNRAEVLLNPFDWGGLQAEEYEILFLSERSLAVCVDTVVWERALDVIPRDWYFLWINDCVSYAASVARIIGLDAPLGESYRPMTFIDNLIRRNH